MSTPRGDRPDEILVFGASGFTGQYVVEYVAKALEKKGHVVICVAEGAGQDVLGAESVGTDASGNPILKDIGTFLRDTFKARIKVRHSFIRLPHHSSHPA